jgi:hypothetical protein
MHVAWRLKRAYEGKINGLVNAGQKVAWQWVAFYWRHNCNTWKRLW